MSPETRALAWKEWRSLRTTLLVTPLLIVAVGSYLGQSFHSAAPELLLGGLGPLLAAIAGGVGLGSEHEGAGLGWLRARAVAPRRVLSVKLASQLVLLVTAAACVALVTLAQRGLQPDGWSPLSDAPFEVVIAFAVVSWLSAFAWANALSWATDSKVAVFCGALLLSWLIGVLLTWPAQLLAGQLQGTVTLPLLLAPAQLGPPVVLACWGYRRFDPLSTPWPWRRVVAALGLVFATGLLGFWISLGPALEARSLRVDLQSAARVETTPHPERSELRAHQAWLENGESRVALEDSPGGLVVLPRGTTFLGWYEPGPHERAVVSWPKGRTRLVHPEGMTDWANPGLLARWKAQDSEEER